MHGLSVRFATGARLCVPVRVVGCIRFGPFECFGLSVRLRRLLRPGKQAKHQKVERRFQSGGGTKAIRGSAMKYTARVHYWHVRICACM